MGHEADEDILSEPVRAPTNRQEVSIMYDVFISYRRDRDAPLARLVRAELKHRGLRVFLDVDDLRPGRFDEALLKCIEDTPNFVVILSSASLDRCAMPTDWFRREIVCALGMNKRIIPIMMPGFNFPAEQDLPEQLRPIRIHHGVNYSHDFFDAMIDKVVSYLATPPSDSEKARHFISLEGETTPGRRADAGQPGGASQGQAAPESAQEMSNVSFFSAADEAMSYVISPQVFDESLLLNILFQERILLHEAYFFNSGNLGTHVSTAAGFPSLFEVAAQNGIITPGFRDRTCRSLEQAYDLMQKGHVYGQSWSLVHPQVKPVLFRIIAAVDEGTEKHGPYYWPEQIDVGAGYESVVRRFLQKHEPPPHLKPGSERDAFFRRLWERTRKWRFDCVDEAVRQTTQKGQSGLQRTELYRAIGRSLGATDLEGTDPGHSLSGKCADKEERKTVDVFLKWIGQLHHLNFAKAFDVSINFPVYNLDEDFVIESLLRSPLDAQPTLAEGFRCTVLLPPIDELLKADPRNLSAIRSDVGKGYLLALKRWQHNPLSGENRQDVETTLQDYCQQITKRYQCGGVPVIASFGPRGTSEHVRTMGDMMGTQLASSVPGGGVFWTIAKFVKTAYAYTRACRQELETAPRFREIEVTLPPG
jgi:hypothetical protein